MPKWYVTVREREEIRYEPVQIEADTEEQACQKAEEMACDGSLDAGSSATFRSSEATKD